MSTVATLLCAGLSNVTLPDRSFLQQEQAMFVRYNFAFRSLEIVSLTARGLYRHVAFANSYDHAKRLVRRGWDIPKSF